MEKQVTKEQIAAWKEAHEGVFKITVEDKVAFLRSPTRKEMEYAGQVAKTSTIKFNEYCLKTCWLAGDEEIQTKDSYFMGASGQIAAILNIKESKLEKL